MLKRSALIFALVLALSPMASGTTAASSSIEEFDVHAGDAFLQGLGFPAGAVARAANGDTITVVFTGKIEPKAGEAEGKGTFEHRNSAGALLATGTFEAEALLGFTDFGTQAGLPPTFHGGSAVIRVHAEGHPISNPAATVEFDATLGVDCRIGNFPSGFKEGITFDAAFINFTDKVSGVTVFVAEEAD